MTNMATMPIYSKKPFKLFLQNQLTSGHETLHVASSTTVLTNVIFIVVDCVKDGLTVFAK